MKNLFSIIVLSFIAFSVFGQKEANNINLYLQNGQFDIARQYIDSLLDKRVYRNDAYYQYLSGRVYRGLYESSDPNDIDSRIQFIEESFVHFLNAYDFSTNTGNKIYLNNCIQILDIALAFVNDLLEDEKMDQAFDLNSYMFDMINEQKSFPSNKVVEVGVKYALILEKKEEYQKAIEVYEKLIEDEKYHPEVFLNLSYLYQSENNFERVVEVLINGRKLFPNSNALSVELVNYTLQSEDSESVMEELESAYENDSTNFQLLTTLATLYDKMEHYEDAKAYYIRAIELKSDLLELQFNYAVLLYNQYIDLNKFLVTGNSDLSMQDINAQRNKLIRQCENQFKLLIDKDFRKEEILKILEQLEE